MHDIHYNYYLIYRSGRKFSINLSSVLTLQSISDFETDFKSFNKDINAIISHCNKEIIKTIQ